MKEDRIQTPHIGQVQKRWEAWAKVTSGLDHQEGSWTSLGREGTHAAAWEEKSNWLKFRSSRDIIIRPQDMQGTEQYVRQHRQERSSKVKLEEILKALI